MLFLKNTLRIKGYIAVIAVAIYASLSIFGLYFSMSNGIDIDVNACFSQTDAGCDTAIDHITHWQGLFITTSNVNQILSLESVIVFVVIPLSLMVLLITAHKFYKKEHLTVVSNYFIRHLPDLQPQP